MFLTIFKREQYSVLSSRLYRATADCKLSTANFYKSLNKFHISKNLKIRHYRQTLNSASKKTASNLKYLLL